MQNSMLLAYNLAEQAPSGLHTALIVSKALFLCVLCEGDIGDLRAAVMQRTSDLSVT